jgi:hypothetical protein
MLDVSIVYPRALQECRSKKDLKSILTVLFLVSFLLLLPAPKELRLTVISNLTTQTVIIISTGKSFSLVFLSLKWGWYHGKSEEQMSYCILSA